MGSQNFMLWLVIAVVDAIVLYVAALFYPTSVVLGNETLSDWLAAILTATSLTVILYLVKPVLKTAKLKVKGDLAINITYVVTNIVGLWVLARLASLVGFGVSSFVVVIVLGLVLTLVQYAVWKVIAGKTGKR